MQFISRETGKQTLLGELGTGGKIMIKFVFKKRHERIWVDFKISRVRIQWAMWCSSGSHDRLESPDQMNDSDIPYGGFLFRSVKFPRAFICTAISTTRSINKWTQSGRTEPSLRDHERCTVATQYVYKVNKLTFNKPLHENTAVHFVDSSGALVNLTVWICTFITTLLILTYFISVVLTLLISTGWET
jgi:hypothetical protein